MSNDTTIIGISGKARAGKDTVAGMLAKRLPNTRIISLAAALKERAAAEWGWSPENKNESARSVLSRFGFSNGAWLDNEETSFLQWYGTDYCRRLFGENYWIELLEDEIASIGEAERLDFVIVPDVRFRNEWHWVRCNGFTLMVKVHPDTFDRDGAHISENDWVGLPFDKTFEANRGDLDYLECQVDQFVKKTLLEQWLRKGGE